MRDAAVAGMWLTTAVSPQPKLDKVSIAASLSSPRNFAGGVKHLLF